MVHVCLDVKTIIGDYPVEMNVIIFAFIEHVTLILVAAPKDVYAILWADVGKL